MKVTNTRARLDVVQDILKDIDYRIKDRESWIENAGEFEESIKTYKAYIEEAEKVATYLLNNISSIK